MKKNLIRRAVLGGMFLAAVAAGATETEPALLHAINLDEPEVRRIIAENPYAKLEKDPDGSSVLVMRIPQNQQPVNGKYISGRLEFPLRPLEKFRNRQLIFAADIAHSRLSAPSHPWNGLKFMIIRTNQFGTDHAGYEEKILDARGWFDARIRYRTGPVLRELKLSCGLQDSWGEARFRNIRIYGEKETSYQLSPIPVPDWVDSEIQKTYARFAKWRGNDPVIVFPIITDLHSANRETFRHIVYVQHADKTFHFDFIANLGDIGLDTEFTSVPDAAEEFLLRDAELENRYPGVLLFCEGNHERNRMVPRDRWISDQRIGDLFNRPNLKRGHEVFLSENGTYGYYDVPGKKVRVFFLNTSDDTMELKEDCAISLKQMQFFADHLKFPQPGWTVAVLNHCCVQPFANEANGRPLRNGDLCAGIMAAFNAGGKGELRGVAWDFTGNRDCRLACNLCGHAHADRAGKIDGVNYIVTQGYGTLWPQNVPRQATYRRFDPQETMNVDIVALKPEKREIKLFRLGVPDAAFDRSFPY